MTRPDSKPETPLVRTDQELPARLREQLRAGDPLHSDDALSPLQATRIRNAMLAEANRHRPQYGWRLAAVAAALSAAIGGSYLLRLTESTTTTPADVLAASGAAGARIARTVDPEEPDRQIQFTTPGGTRVIWLLKPKATLEP